MDEHSTRPLQYGHLGRAVYDTDTQAWSFPRTLASAPHISYAGVTKTTVCSPLTTPQYSSIVNKELLPRVYPEIAAAPSFTRNEALSHVITTTSEVCDPLVSSLLDFGYALDLDNEASTSRAIPIAVVASGECGNAVSFRIIGEDTVEVKKQDTTSSMRVPSITEEVFEWSTGGAPIRQICFSRAAEQNPTYMAVRCSCSTAIFRPVYHRNPVPIRRNRLDNPMALETLYNSCLDPNLLVEISSAHTGGFEHAGVTFNPWDEKQLAIVDAKGNWGIWKLTSRRKRGESNWVSECIKSGSLPWLEDGQYIGNRPRHDGWLAIEWVGTNNLLVCDRRCSILYKMDGEEMSSYPVELGFKRKSEWILDIKRSTCNSSHVFILTTSQIFWLDLLSFDDNSGPSVYPRLSWRHFRDPEDTTLLLTPLLLSEDFYLVLYSRLNQLTVVFHCPFTSDGLSETAPVPDPFILDVSQPSEYVEESQPQILPMHKRFTTLVFREVMHSRPSLWKGNYDPNLRLLKLFVLDSSLSVRESIYVGASHGLPEEEPPPPALNALRLRKRFVTKRRTNYVSPADNFIVDDWDESVRTADLSAGLGILDTLDSRIPVIAPCAIQQRTLDYTQIYAIATGSLVLASGAGDERTCHRGFRDFIQELAEGNLDDSPSIQPTSRTVLEIFDGHPTLDDIDQHSRNINDFVSRSTSEQPKRSQFFVPPFNPLCSPYSYDVGSPDPFKLDLITIYDHLINSWLASLPHEIPGHARIAKEKIARSVAAELVLARIIKLPKLEAEHIQQKRSGNDVPSSSATYVDTPSIADDEQNLFVPIGAPEMPELGNNRATQDDLAAEEDNFPVLSSLSSFTTFTGVDSISPTVARMLDQWQTGADPEEYISTRMLGSQASRTASNLITPKRKSRKKTTQEKSQDPPLLLPAPSSVPTIRDYGSQPDYTSQPFTVRLQSSQVTADDLPMTQVERGVFGGREANRKSMMKARKKKRAAGF